MNVCSGYSTRSRACNDKMLGLCPLAFIHNEHGSLLEVRCPRKQGNCKKIQGVYIEDSIYINHIQVKG